MLETAYNPEIAIRPYEPRDWASIWQLQDAKLFEAGIEVDTSVAPSRSSIEDARMAKRYGEDDLFFIDETYLCSGGGFWLAWAGKKPVGSVGAQDLGGVIELRRMFVMAAYRRRGIGAQLVGRLIEHCTANGIRAVELWTDPDGLGKFLYKKMGFRVVGGKGPGFEAAQDRPKEIRMRLELNPGGNSTEVV